MESDDFTAAHSVSKPMYKRILSRMRTRKLARESDYGRRFGWELLRHGKLCAELEYVEFDISSQFWHKYRIKWSEGCGTSHLPYEQWAEMGLCLRNKRFQEVVIEHYLAAGRGDGYVLPRGAYVPDEVLARG